MTTSVERRPLPASDWIAALEAIQESRALRTGREQVSRAYRSADSFE